MSPYGGGMLLLLLACSNRKINGSRYTGDTTYDMGYLSPPLWEWEPIAKKSFSVILLLLLSSIVRHIYT